MKKSILWLVSVLFLLPFAITSCEEDTGLVNPYGDWKNRNQLYIDSIAKEAKEILDKGVSIEKVNGRSALFTIQPTDGSYKVSFGKEEFEDYFKSFLRPQLVQMLF